MKTCYYEQIGVDRKATEDEIKKQFKKKAMQLHPDKNHDDPDATKKFQDLNEAYQCLIDANERAWYDAHRTQILSGKNFGEDAEEESFQFNIWQYFSTSCYKGFGDNEGGFYKVFTEVFDLIIGEEEEARLDSFEKEENLPSYKTAPRFGSSSTPLEDVAKFYEYWDNFITSKNFAWADEHKTSKDYERRMNRMIDQDNKKARLKEKKKYLETIQNLVVFVQKRDPRVVAMKEMQKEQEQKKKAEREQKELEKKKQKEEEKKRAREEELRRFAELDRMKEETKAQGHDEEDEEEEEFYCPACKKGFRSENQLKNHEKSKQHLKAVKDLLAEVALDGEEDKIESVEKELNRINGMKTQESPESKNKKKKKKKGKGNIQNDDNSDEEETPQEVSTKHTEEPTIVKDKDEPSETKEDQIKDDDKSEDEGGSEDESESKNELGGKNKKKKKQAAKAKRQAEALGLVTPKVEEKQKVPVETKAAKKKAEKKAAWEASKANQTQAKENEKPEEAKKDESKAENDSKSGDEKEGDQKTKKDKRKQKPQEKDPKAKEPQKDEKSKIDSLECKYCGEVFEIKTKLFDHLKKKHKLKF